MSSSRERTALRHPASYARLLIVAASGLALDLWSKSWAFHTLTPGDRRVLIPHLLEFQVMLNPGALFGVGPGKTTLFLIASLFALLLVIWMFAQSSPRRWFLHLALGAILAGALGNLYDRVAVKLLDQAFRWPTVTYPVYVERDGADQHGEILREYPPRAGGLEFRMTSEESADGEQYVLREFPPGGRARYFPFPHPPRDVGYVRDFIKIPTRWFGGHELWPWVFNVADTLLVCGVSILALYLWRDRKPPAVIEAPVERKPPPGPDPQPSP